MNKVSKFSEFEKKQKIELLKSIQAKEIKPEDLNPDSVVISDTRQAFTGLLTSVARSKQGKDSNIVFIGAAKKAVAESFENIKTQRDKP